MTGPSQPVGRPRRIDEKLAALPEDGCAWSLEFFPPKTNEGFVNLFARILRMIGGLAPAWADVTWGAGGSTAEGSMELACRVQNGLLDPTADWRQCGSPEAPVNTTNGTDVCLHLTCTNVERDSVAKSLEEAHRCGIRNVLALRGDPPRGEEYWVATDQHLQHGVDLVRYIRKTYGDAFCIGVAGYPEGHEDTTAVDEAAELAFLKEKQDAGASFIVTQLFYDAERFVAWYRRCREAGITIPVVPGILPIQNYQSFRRMSKLCGVHAPDWILQELEPIKMDDALVKDLGVRVSIQLIEHIRAHTDVRAFHFYTLNLEKSVSRVVGGVTGVAKERAGPSVNPVSRMPLTPAPETWDEFPNGRYTDARSPAFGEIDGYGASLKVAPDEAVRLWGTPVDEDDIARIFEAYVGGTLACIPWCDIPLWDETIQLRPALQRLNRGRSAGGKSWWTVGSQPAVDAAPSTDPTFGFGPANGFIFQKAFVELFVDQREKDALLRRLAKTGNVTYYAAAARPNTFETNMPSGGLDAVTWGVFPGKEVVQSTIIEEQSFRAWRDEAFAIWREWELLFPPQSATRKLLRHVHDSRWLVTVIHHDYKGEDALWRLLLDDE